MIRLILLLPLLFAPLVEAGSSRQECLGRVAFDVQEEIEWAVFSNKRVTRIADARGGGHRFTDKVAGRWERLSYGTDHNAIVYVTAPTTREKFDGAANYIRGRGTLYQEELRKKIEIKKYRIQRMQAGNYSTPEDIKSVEEEIREVEADIPLAQIYDHDLGIPDSHALGSKEIPFRLLLWRDSRVYYFVFSRPDAGTAVYMQDLARRFRTRALYEVPQEPGICFPYGFIADDGKVPFDLRFSLRFTRTPNVIVSLLTASTGNPTEPTKGLYDTDFYPGFDRRKWRRVNLIEQVYFGKWLSTFTGWHLTPTPEGGEQERAWFGHAHIGGPGSSLPMLAIQVQTFEKGIDDLTEHTPPPETVMPRIQALTRSLHYREGVPR
ncbi:T6SS immunity protein Tli4 family protein [Metapseudomonas sp. CR1201]